MNIITRGMGENQRLIVHGVGVRDIIVILFGQGGGKAYDKIVTQIHQTFSLSVLVAKKMSYNFRSKLLIAKKYSKKYFLDR